MSIDFADLCRGYPDEFYNKVAPALLDLLKVPISPQLHESFVASLKELLTVQHDHISQRLINTRLVKCLQKRQDFKTRFEKNVSEVKFLKKIPTFQEKIRRYTFCLLTNVVLKKIYDHKLNFRQNTSFCDHFLMKILI